MPFPNHNTESSSTCLNTMAQQRSLKLTLLFCKNRGQGGLELRFDPRGHWRILSNTWLMPWSWFISPGMSRTCQLYQLIGERELMLFPTSLPCCLCCLIPPHSIQIKGGIRLCCLHRDEMYLIVAFECSRMLCSSAATSINQLVGY